MKIVSASEMREIDRISIEERGIPGLELMEQAGRAASEFVLTKFNPKNVCITTGKGNNAGDGFVIARLLSEKNINVSVLMLSSEEELKGDALENFKRLPDKVQKINISDASDCVIYFSNSDIIIDAILGTGVKGEVKGLFADVICELENSHNAGKNIIAVDIPSGLPCDGEKPPGPAVKANYTITMGLPKLGMVLYPGLEYCGEIITAQLSFPEDLLKSEKLKHNFVEHKDISNMLPSRRPDSNKRTFGYAQIIAGSEGMSGAAILAGRAALRSGAGLIYMCIPEKISNVLENKLLEPVKIIIPSSGGEKFDNKSIKRILEISNKADGVALGPGIGASENTFEMVLDIICKIKKPLILDADGLNAVSRNPGILKKRKFPTIITPHPGEMARLCKTTVDEIQKNRIKSASDFSAEYNVITVLKGARTVIADTDGSVYINSTGNTSLAKGGSGDVLTGLMVGLLVQGLSPINSALTGVYIHGMAGDIACESMNERFILPSDIIKFFNDCYKKLSRTETFPLQSK